MIAHVAATSARRRDEALQVGLVEAWLNSQSSPNTLAAYRADIAKFGTWCASRGSIALRADATTLVAFQVAREAAGDSPSTLRRRWSALSSFYDFAVINEATSTNPVHGATRPRVGVGNPSPTAQLSASAVDSYRAIAASLDPRLEVLVGLLVSDGLKLGEALALNVDDVSGRSPKTVITIRRRGQVQKITLDADTARAVRRCVGSRREGPLLASERATSGSERPRLTRFGADHLIRQLSNEDGKRVTANELRRFHISTSNDQADDLDDVRVRAGLADVRSVRRYLVATT
ncbi:MAG: site-specific integrase [Ilumatobacteraceae bacterium]